MEIQRKKVLVTGAGGFIGSHLAEELVRRGANVRAFVRYRSDGSIGKLSEIPRELLKKIEIFRGDLKSIDSVKEAMSEIDVVFHLGALISIPHSYVDPGNFFETNVLGTLNILREAKEKKIKKIVITSTSEVYGTAEYVPIDEAHVLKPQSPYSASKISADSLTKSFFLSYGLPITIIRPFNTYGPRQSKRSIIPTIVYQALIGDKIRLGTLNTKRDFNYVTDTVDGFIKIAESDQSVGETINICSGNSISIQELITKIEKILSKKLIIETDEKKIRPEKSEVMVLQGDNEKAKRILGWESRISLDEGLKKVVDYIRNNLNAYEMEGENL